MKIVIPGGSGHVGQMLKRHLAAEGHDIIVLSRHPKKGKTEWDGKTLDGWAETLEGADAVINLAGRSVNCRYHEANLKEMMDSRVDSTRVIGQAIAACKSPPRVWLQASTATIYAQRFDAPNDELTGILGGGEPDAPPKWRASVAIAKAWEGELEYANTPRTRKVALRSSVTLSPEKGSIFDVMASLARLGIGGTAGSGRQFVSWVHEDDFVEAVKFLIEREDLSGPVNVCSPNPIPNREFNRILREAVGAKFSFPSAEWMLEIGARLMGTETELLLKSRRVVPTRLLTAGFQFRFPIWKEATQELAARWQVGGR